MITSTQDIRELLNRSLIQRFLTERLMSFINESGIAGLLESRPRFMMEEAVASLQHKLGYTINDRIRLRMIKVIVDLLCESGCLMNDNGSYLWNKGKGPDASLSHDECLTVKETVTGQVEFFEQCMAYADKFLRGGPPLFGFDSASTLVWEKFLGNSEFSFARSVLVNLLLSGRNENLQVLDLCYGPGFGILQMQERFSDIGITALDFKDIFLGQASRRITNTGLVKWIKSERWKGFGSPLPFLNHTFDIVFFACADPYIPEGSREYVYKDIFRILKPGGSLGILSHSYPDADRQYVGDDWIRRGVLCHDFSESVCEGWYGFYDARESVRLFESIGYGINTIMLNASVWRLDKTRG
ncbi:MAG: class I SAM-dependent methyltransferase [Nitrospirae bacterium]|nr:class I SAM-dependent methyltransferase [Nitrospirota bacterium]